MIKLLKIFIVCAVFITLLVRIVPDFFQNSGCGIYDEFLLRSLNGVIFQKYIDSSQHSYKTIVIKNNENSNLEKLLLDYDTSNVYDNLKVHDTIFKEVNNDSLFIIRNNKKYLLSKIDFGCSR